jgi:hypothetical protein
VGEGERRVEVRVEGFRVRVRVRVTPLLCLLFILLLPFPRSRHSLAASPVSSRSLFPARRRSLSLVTLFIAYISVAHLVVGWLHPLQAVGVRDCEWFALQSPDLVRRHVRCASANTHIHGWRDAFIACQEPLQHLGPQGHDQ